MQQDFNTQSKPEGKRAGVKATEIADTIEAVLAYFEATKQGYPTFLEAIRQESDGWKGHLIQLRGGDQAAVDGFFGQPAPKDVEDALTAAGLAAKSRGEPGFDEYNQKYVEMWDRMQKNAGAYCPGSPTSSLDDYRNILQFDSYREKLDGQQDGPATQLVNRIDAFEGDRGSKHLALTNLMHQTYDYIGNTPRHPSETYVAPDSVEPDYLNAFDHMWSPYIDWHPSADMTQVTGRISHGTGELPEKKTAYLAYEQVKYAAALERASIPADVHVELGRTYAEDAVVVTMSMADYTGRFLAIKRGEIDIDRSVPDSTFKGSLRTTDHYAGYEPGKAAFYYNSDLLVSPAMMKELTADFPDKRFLGAVEALDFLRDTNSLVETTETMPVAPGKTETFTRLSAVRPKAIQKVYEFEGFFYDSCDLQNEVSRSLREINAAINGLPAPESNSRGQEKPDDVWFEHAGDTYLPRGEKYYQIALHMRHKYGVDFTWVFRDKEGQAKAKGMEKYVLSTSALDPASHDAAMADLKDWLKQDWNAKDVRSATVLRHKIRIGKPLALAPKA